MIKGKIKQNLTMDAILEKTSELDIFSFFIPIKGWKLNEIMHSPLREDKNSSFLVGNKYGTINFKDFARDDHKGDCFKFVQLMYNLPNLDAVLRLIDKEMNLGISDGREIQSSPISQINRPEITKRNTLIQVITRKFTNEELAYWNEYHQSITDLHDNNIYSIKTLYFNKSKFPLKDSELRFGYYYPEGGFWKIYFVNREKRKKWLGNVPLNRSWGTENLKKDKNSLICKSLKDYLVCKKIISTVCGIQNESLAAFSPEFVSSIKENSKDVFYGGDSDVPGKQASYAITGEFGYKHINPPDNLLDCCKDFADMGRFKSLKSVEEHFKIKGLIT